MYKILAYFLSNTYRLAQVPSPFEMKFCSAKASVYGHRDCKLPFNCLETYSHNENSLESVGESSVRPVYTFNAYFFIVLNNISSLFYVYHSLLSSLGCSPESVPITQPSLVIIEKNTKNFLSQSDLT